MKITPFNVAVLDDSQDTLLSRWIEKDGRLDHDGAIPIHYLPHIRHGDVVIDAGAALGDHTIAYIKACGFDDNVFAFECNPLMLECLRHNCPGAKIHPVALSDENGKAWMVNHNDNPGGNFLTKDSSLGYEVTTAKLDSFGFTRINFIKWDIEGYELRALMGAIETVSRCRPKMIMEVNPWMLKRAGTSVDELFSMMAMLRYSIQQIMGDPPNPSDPESRGEFLFLPQ